MADNTAMLSTMRKRLQMAQAAYSDSRADELQDLRFFAGSPDNNWQWPADVLSTRGALQGQTVNARPILTINVLPQHVRQVTNDQRQNRPSAKVIPVDDGADVEVAEVFEGMVRHIEYVSDADVAYDTACENQVSYGEGYIRILTDYTADDSFDQDIRIGRIRNSFSVYMDPTIQDPTGADAKWCFVCEDLLKDEYERLYPNATPISTLLDMGTGDESMGAWLAEETIRIAEYFYVDYVPDELYEYADGKTAFATELVARVRNARGEKPVRKRAVQRKVIKWCKTNGAEIIEEQEWPGKWIPIVRVPGNEYEVEGRIYLSGIVRNAKDAQRMLNYWTSQEAEMLALAPKAPFIGYGGQFEGYETQWKSANVQNWPYLEVNAEVTDAQGSPLPLPQRAPPPLPQAGIFQAKLGAADDIKAVTGQYDASLGNMSNETSGKAIIARERQSDTGTYHFVDNLARAIRHVGRQIVDLIPKIYDTARIARIIGMDDEVKMVKLNPAQQQPVQAQRDENGAIIEKIYNLNVGKYDIMVTTGPSYMTKRQEGMNTLAQMIQGNSALWGVMGDQLIRLMDMPYAEEMSDRMKRWIEKTNPGIIEEGEDTPELAAAKQQNMALQQHLQQAMQMLEKVQQSQEAQGVQIDAYNAETQRLKAVLGSAGAPGAMNEQQVQDIVLGMIHAMMSTGDMPVFGGEDRGAVGPPEMPQMPPQQPQMQPQGAMQ